jgi:gliding motility-associated-like protein
MYELRHEFYFFVLLAFICGFSNELRADSFLKPMGDDPCGSTPLPNNMLTFIEIDLDGGPSGEDDPGCGEFNGNDNWYSIIVPASGSLAIELEAGSVINAAFALYYGPCSNPTLINCVPNYLCGEDPMPKYFYEDLTPGTTVYLRIWDEDGVGGTVFIRSSNPYGNSYLTAGSAMPISFQGSSNCIQLTDESAWQLGCAWYPESQDFSEPFDYKYSLYFGTRDGNGADGMAIVFQINGIPICGEGDAGLGAQGIPNSWIIEFDTWQNGGNYGDPVADHCAINVNGVMNHSIHPPVELPNIEDGNFHEIRVSWDPASFTFSVYFDGLLLISVDYDIVNNVFGGNPNAFWGVTAGTGGAWNEHILCFENIELENLNPVYVTVDATICYGDEYFAGGGYQTEPGEYIDIYVAANGCDSVVTTNLEVWPEVFDSEIDTLLCEGEILFYEGVFYNQPGNYEVTLQNANGCDSLVYLAIEYVEIIASLQPADVLTCYDPVTSLGVDVQGDPTYIRYFWYTSDGNILTDPALPEIEVDAPGFYYVEVSFDNGVVQCGPLVLSVFVEADQENPVIVLETDGELGCDESTMFIDAGQSQGGTQYEWFATIGGDIIGGQGTPRIEIDGPGTYTLILTNEQNGCQSEADIVIVRAQVPPVISILAPDSLTCRDTFVWIDARGSEQQPFFTYQWTTGNGLILEGANTLHVRAGAPGIYTLTILNTDNGCESTANVEVFTFYDTIGLSFDDPGLLLCKRRSLDLQVQLAPPPRPFSIQWSTTNGNIVSLSNNNTRALIDAPGLYRVQVINEENGCSSEATIEVNSDFEAPEADAGDDITITCREPEKNLDGNGSDQGPEFTYQWTTNQGLILSGGNGLSPLVGRSGPYQLIVTDTLNGCTASDEVVVVSNDAYPVITIAPPLVLNCFQPEIRLDAGGSDEGDPFVILWQTQEGELEDGEMTLNPLVSGSGWYYFRVENEENGCVSIDSVRVAEDFTPPTVEAGPGALFTCTTDSLILDGTGSSVGPQFTYNWSTMDGNILRLSNSLNPVIDAPGLYQLMVTNTDNGCTAVDTVRMEADDNLPVIVLPEPLVLTCERSVVTINAAGSSDGANFAYVWSTTDGTFQLVSKQVIEVIRPGTYLLEITNTDNDCLSQRTVEVRQDTIRPLADILMPMVLNCRDSLLSAQVQVLTDDSNLDIRWTTTNGNIVSGMNALNASFDRAGTYILTLRNRNNGCDQTFTAVVDEDREIPTVVLNTPDTLTCAQAEVWLLSDGSDVGVPFSYSWMADNGFVFSDPTAADQRVTEAGRYTLTILNERNFCQRQLSINVLEDRVLPDAQVILPDSITCARPIVVLDGRPSSSGADFRYSWTTSNGNIVAGENTNQPSVNRVGTYSLVVTNEQTGCTREVSVSVGSNVTAPLADAGEDRQLTCRISTLRLEGMATSTHGPVLAQWTTQDGQILSGADGLQPLIGARGAYRLVVTDPYNGCTAEDVAVVFPNEDTIVAANTRIVQPNCQQNVGNIAFLDITGGAAPYEYSIDGGATFGSQREFNRQAPGTYRLVVRDSNGCMLTIDTVLRSVIPVRIDIQPYFIVPLGETVNLNPESNLAPGLVPDWQWEPPVYLDCTDCRDVVSRPLEEIRYIVRATDHNGCVDEAETWIRVVREGGVFIPDAFTPGDKNGLNDRFTVFGSADMIERVDFLEIFDRWGNRMFLREDFPINDEESGWDGSFREQPMNPGVFVYVAKVTFINGTSEVYHGDVTLIR